jgi:hypothetical protein
MANFSHLKALEQKAEARPYRFADIEGSPSIYFLPGTDANKTFMNESLRRAAARTAGGGRGRRVTTDTVAEARQEDREVLAFTCAQSWDVKDADGNPVEFTPQNCLEFFEALPDWLFDGVRNWVTNPVNFVGDVLGMSSGPSDGGQALGEA